MNGSKSAKFAKVLSLESFPLYGIFGDLRTCFYGRKQNGSFSFKLLKVENPPSGGRKRGGREGGRGGGGGGENDSHVSIEEATGATVCGLCSDLKD